MSVAIPSTTPAHPWRKSLRTFVQGLIAVSAFTPLLWEEFSGGAEATGVLGGMLLLMGVITRIMNTPGVESFLTRFLPFLAASDLEIPEQEEEEETEEVEQ